MESLDPVFRKGHPVPSIRTPGVLGSANRLSKYMGTKERAMYLDRAYIHKLTSNIYTYISDYQFTSSRSLPRGKY